MTTRNLFYTAFALPRSLRPHFGAAPISAGCRPNRLRYAPGLGLALAAAFLILGFSPFSTAQTPGQAPGENIIRAIPPGVDPAGFHIQLGYLNAALPPYNADPTGIVDATTALQNAVNAARDHQLVLFLPAGTYLVSDTIKCVMPALNPDPDCNTRGDDSFRALAPQILGSRLGVGVTIRLKDNAAGFGNSGSPKPVFDFYAEGFLAGNCTLVRLPSGLNYNHTLRHVRILIGSSNAGAVGVNMGTAQGGLLEDVLVESVAGTPFFAGAYDVPGQGGGTYNLEVIGGQYGAYITQASRFPLLVGCRFKNQTVVGVSYVHNGPLVIAGCLFDEPVGVDGLELFEETASLNAFTAKTVAVTIVDSVFKLESGTVAVVNPELKNVHLYNVYLAQDVVAVRNGTTDWTPGAKSIINQYAYTNLDAGEESSTNLIDGVLSKTEIQDFAAYLTTLPDIATLRARHTWGATELPSFEDSDTVIASASLGADGAGDVTVSLQSLIDATVSSPNKKIFLPKGIYNISTLTLHPDTKLFGASNYFSVLKSIADPVAGPIRPLVTTDDAATGTGSLSRLHLVTNNTSATRNHMVVWKLGEASRLHSLVSDDWGMETLHYVANRVYWALGSGGGRWYSLLSRLPADIPDPDFKTFFVDGTTQPLSIYGWASDNTFTEVIGATNVRFFFFKTEPANDQSVPRSPVDPLVVENSTNVAVFGTNGASLKLDQTATGAMVTVRDSEQVLGSQIRILNKTFSGGGTYPSDWFSLQEFRGANPPIEVPAVNMVNVFARGTFNLAPFGVPSAPTTTVTFTSIGSEDGFLRESTESSNVGNLANATGIGSSALQTGDNSNDRQLKSVVSFDTASLPDGATIISATLKLRRGSVTGTSPFTTHGTCYVDIKGGMGFGSDPALVPGDFETAADAVQVAAMSTAAINGALSTGSLNSTGRSFINKTGKTQFRIYFSTDDNDDSGNDYIGWYSGENSTAENRPVLEIVYQ